MNCPNCNKEVSPDWKLCPFCGFVPKKCSNPECQPRWLPQEAKFCPECGKALTTLDRCSETITEQGTVSNDNSELATAIKYFENEEYAKALPLFHKLAISNNAEAQFYLSVYYWCGDDYPGCVDEDEEESVKWIKKAAINGHAKAQLGLACLYSNGDVVDKNPQEAMKWLRIAAEKGLAEAQYELAECYYSPEYSLADNCVVENPEEAVKWFRKAAEQGHVEAQFDLWCINKDTIEAYQWQEKLLAAAKQGQAEAQFWLARTYDDINDKEAAKWYQKSAEYGYARAQYDLAYLYSEGIGVDKNMGEAIKWYRKAAEQGHKEAKEKLKQLNV